MLGDVFDLTVLTFSCFSLRLSLLGSHPRLLKMLFFSPYDEADLSLVHDFAVIFFAFTAV